MWKLVSIRIGRGWRAESSAGRSRRENLRGELQLSVCEYSHVVTGPKQVEATFRKAFWDSKGIQQCARDVQHSL